MYVFAQNGTGFNFDILHGYTVQPSGNSFDLVAFTVKEEPVVIGSYDTEDAANAAFRKLKIALAHDDSICKMNE